MKAVKFYFASLLAACAFTGCSDDLGNEVTPEETTGQGYINVAINLPTQTGMTKAANDDFDDGSADEYTVSTSYLAIFEGDTEADATFKKGMDLTLEWGNVGGNVTTKASLVQKVDLTPGSNYWALVILNKNNKITAGETALQIGSTSVTNLAALKTAITGTSAADFIGESKNNFLMLNAPLASVPGNTVESSSTQLVRTLVPITVYNSETAAQESKDDEIFVERIVAKVTVQLASTVTPVEGNANRFSVSNTGDFSDDEVEFEGWFLNVTNNSTKFMRDVTGADTDWKGYNNTSATTNSNNRFFSTDKLANTSTPYRIYWAVDNNYDGSSYGENAFTVYVQESAEPSTLNNLTTATEVHPDYCLENTFNAANMKKAQTTGVVFKMKYFFDAERGAETFFMLDGEETIYTASGDNSLVSKVNEKLGDSNKIESLALAATLAGGYYATIADIKKLLKNGTSDLNDTQAQNILSVVGQIKVYENGTSYYYTSQIQHFGDTYTPMGTATEYNDNDHLGRYGVVRNNWYEINIASVSGPGSPTIPEVPEEPDDKKDYFINVKVNILSWAKRSQNVDL